MNKAAGGVGGPALGCESTSRTPEKTYDSLKLQGWANITLLFGTDSSNPTESVEELTTRRSATEIDLVIHAPIVPQPRTKGNRS